MRRGQSNFLHFRRKKTLFDGSDPAIWPGHQPVNTASPHLLIGKANRLWGLDRVLARGDADRIPVPSDDRMALETDRRSLAMTTVFLR